MFIFCVLTILIFFPELFGTNEPEMLGTVTKDHKTLKMQLKSLEESFRRQEAVMEPKDVVNREYTKIHGHFTLLKDNLEILQYLITMLEEMCEMKRKRFLWMRSDMSRQVKTSFSVHLQQRKFNGLLKFDHKNKALNITISPSEGNSTLFI